MELKKRDCPIEIEILPRGAGWTDISWFVPEQMPEPLILKASDIGYNIGDFARALYYLSPNQPELGGDGAKVEIVWYEYDSTTGRYGKMHRQGESLTPGGSYVMLPVKAEFSFEEEPGGSEWILSRNPPTEPNNDNDFPVHVHIKLDRYRYGYDCGYELDFDFKYSDLCYAVSKAFTKSIKKYGFYGYLHSASDSIDILNLIFLKAIALGNSDAYELNYHKNKNSANSNFRREIELLVFDM